MKQSTGDKCRAIWRNALHGPITMQFENKKQWVRAKFTLYNSLRSQSLDTLERQEMLELRERLELLLEKAELRITIQLKSINNTEERINDIFDETFSKLPLKEIQDSGPGKTKPGDSISDSLSELQKKLSKQNTQRPSNPYFTRED